ncbi:hypothetical protein [Paraburkholderia ultramafica]|uniref:hypothetical protein n=1 Tax=Paraburkholderia ultramafica TaxID=1544867 RepID=UPI001582D37D|nr:hypothetical protein [Paraburkholderia ultramafica]
MATAAEGIAERLTIEVASAKARIDAAELAGVEVSKARRMLAPGAGACRSEEARIEEFHRVPGNPNASRSRSIVEQIRNAAFERLFLRNPLDCELKSRPEHFADQRGTERIDAMKWLTQAPSEHGKLTKPV